MISTYWVGQASTKLRAPSATLDRLGAVAGLLAVAVIMLPPMITQMAAAPAREAGRQERQPGPLDRLQPRGETVIGAYGGVTYTHDSDVHFRKIGSAANKTDMTLRDVSWIGKPFKSPVYYGARAQKWSSTAPVGAMLDFTHAKTISRPKQEIRVDGTRDGRPVPAKTKIGEMFRHLEFSHGHNMLTLNGLYRFPMLGLRFSPYIGGGLGISLPHTEVGFREPKGQPRQRTYEYQYAGPVAQGLFGIEVRLPQASLFFEYKFSLAPYEVPLSNTYKGGWLYEDLWRQARRWWSGKQPPGGFASTKLLTNHLIAGIAMRIAPAAKRP